MVEDIARPFSYEPLTPSAYLDRSAEVYADDLAVIDGELRLTYRDLRGRCLGMAGVLHAAGVAVGDRVAVLAPNSHVMLEAHYGVPYAGAVLVALNTRLVPRELAAIVAHAGCILLLYDPGFAAQAAEIVERVGSGLAAMAADAEYERRIAAGEPRCVPVSDERGLLALNYTSGTTGSPKGVMYHHRGAYLQALAMAKHFELTARSAYLWTLPMFHCNGWCFTWAVTAAGATHVCLPVFTPPVAWQLIREHGITHFCGAPTVLTMLTADEQAGSNPDQVVRVAVGGAPPSPALISRCERLGLAVTHLYGLTETFGPVAICDWRAEWDALPAEERAAKRAMQGVGNVISHALRVVDGKGADVPRDATTIGEIAIRGNNVMLGYFHDPEATRTAVQDGWFRTGDLAVMYPDGYLQIRDRAKDVIISGGENISSVEVEATLMAHPDVLEAAVIAVPHERWGERPVAWVVLRDGATTSEEELRAHTRSRLAGFKVPDHIVFEALPRTGTGKIQKFRLRELGRERFAQ